MAARARDLEAKLSDALHAALRQRFVDQRRATTNNNKRNSTLTPAMDMFSAGCVVTEVFLSGEACLELGDLLEYRAKGEITSTLQQKLQKLNLLAKKPGKKKRTTSQVPPQQNNIN